jgi:hypothetical protein
MTKVSWVEENHAPESGDVKHHRRPRCMNFLLRAIDVGEMSRSFCSDEMKRIIDNSNITVGYEEVMLYVM